MFLIQDNGKNLEEFAGRNYEMAKSKENVRSHKEELVETTMPTSKPLAHIPQLPDVSNNCSCLMLLLLNKRM